MRKYTLLFTLSLIWGSQFLFIALITHDASSITISFYKALLATLFLFIMTLFMRKTPYKKQWGLYILIASLSFAISLVLMQNLQDDVPIHHMRNVLSIATIILIPITIFSSNTFTLHFDSLQWSSLIILGLVHSALAYVIYNILVRQYDAVFASLSNYIVPVVGVLLGVLILHEHLTLNIIIGSAVVLLSLIISQQVKSG